MEHVYLDTRASLLGMMPHSALEGAQEGMVREAGRRLLKRRRRSSGGGGGTHWAVWVALLVIIVLLVLLYFWARAKAKMIIETPDEELTPQQRAHKDGLLKHDIVLTLLGLSAPPKHPYPTDPYPGNPHQPSPMHAPGMVPNYNQPGAPAPYMTEPPQAPPRPPPTYTPGGKPPMAQPTPPADYFRAQPAKNAPPQPPSFPVV